jgi:hypothetical protein
MPRFFRSASEQLAYLNPEPDRWRDGERAAMNEAFRYDHYIDLENVPPGAYTARDRWEFLRALDEADVPNPHPEVGFLPFRLLELYERVTNSFIRWRAETDPERRRWIEERILNDAGILGHYASDASNPHHSTVHFNGWNETLTPNPDGFTTDREFHARFESDFVGAHVTPHAVRAEVPFEAAAITDVRTAIWDFVRESNSHVDELYRLDRDVGFHAELPPDPAALRFATKRLARGAEFLRDLWWGAWVESGRRE